MTDVLAELERLEKEATPARWMWDSDLVKNDPHNRVRYQVVAKGKTITKTYYSSFEGGLTNAEVDTRLIALTRNALPALLAVAKAAREYDAELANPVPDYHLRFQKRQELAAALRFLDEVRP